jgi:threonine dehydratase
VAVEEVASLADSLGGGLGTDNRHSFALCQRLLDDVVLVSEDDIRDAMQMLYYEDRMIAEGASVVGLAALLTGKVSARGPMATIMTGRNPDMAVFTRIVTGQDVTLGDLVVRGKAYGA